MLFLREKGIGLINGHSFVLAFGGLLGILKKEVPHLFSSVTKITELTQETDVNFYRTT